MNAPNRGQAVVPAMSRRAESLGTENAFVVLAEVNALARAGKDIISFCIGQPDFPTPANIQDAAIKAIRDGRHGYTPSAGIDELRAAAAQDMGARRGMTFAPDEIVVGAGAKPFIAYAIASVTDYGVEDEVIYPVPGFPIYESQIVANGAVPVPIYLRESRDFAFDPDALDAAITPRTRLLILNTRTIPPAACCARRTSTRSPTCSRSIRRCGSTPTRSTRASPTKAGSSRSHRARACASARSSAMARRRPGR
jgi:aspartate/methionine/tyrosine aminotransferase